MIADNSTLLSFVEDGIDSETIDIWISCLYHHVILERQPPSWMNDRPGGSIGDVQGLDPKVDCSEDIIHSTESGLCEERTTHRELDSPIRADHHYISVNCEVRAMLGETRSQRVTSTHRVGSGQLHSCPLLLSSCCGKSSGRPVVFGEHLDSST